MEEALYIVDALNFVFRAYHALPPLTTSRGLPTGAVYGLCQMLLRVERENRPTHLCAVFDAPGRTFRSDLYAGYKADRPPMPSDLAAQVELLHRVVDTFRIPKVQVAAVEADDVIATLACQAAERGLRVVICSGDKDLMQVVGDRISMLDTMRNRFIGPNEVREKFGVPPEKVADVLALQGDSIDCIPGVPGIGPKGAAELVNRYGTLENVLAHAGEVKGKKGEALQAAREAVRVSYQLVTLRLDVPLPITVDELRRQEPERPELRAMLREFEFFRIITQEKLDDPLDDATGGPRPEAAPPSPPPPQVTVEVPLVPVEVLRDEEGIDRLLAAVAAAGRCGVALLSEGGEATRADFVGLGFALPGGPRYYVPLGHRLLGEPNAIRGAELLARLAPMLADPAVTKAIHDSKFLEVLLAFRGYRLQGVDADTLLAGYLLDASRNRHDLDLVASSLGVSAELSRPAWLGTGRTSRPPGEIPPDVAGARLGVEAAAVLEVAIAQRQALGGGALDQLYVDLELPLARVLARVEAHGIRIDSLELGRLGEELDRNIGALEADIHRLAGTTFNIGSPKQLGEVLFGKLGLPVVRRTKTGPSTDADVLEELAALHDVPARIVEYRGLTKLKSTYIEALPALVHARTGRLHTTFNQAVAATGRLSSSEPNLQNIPIRTEVGRRIRQAFIADPGHRIVSADYSQIELRILAHFSGDPAFLAAFRSGADIHQRTAAEVFSIPPDSVSAEQRRVAKAINFGLVFGQSDFGLAQTLRIPRATAKAYIASYFERYAGVRAYMERSIVEARETGGAVTLLGRRRPIPEMASRRAQERAHAERVARNTPIQGSAADILKLAMIRVDAGLRTGWPDARLLLTVHDELVFEIPEPQVPDFSDWVRREMQNVYLLEVPLVVDVGSGRTWGEAH